MIPSQGGSFEISVESNAPWSVSCEQSWVSLSTKKGNGNGNVIIALICIALIVVAVIWGGSKIIGNKDKTEQVTLRI